MSDRRASSHDEGELSDEPQRKEDRTNSDSEGENYSKSSKNRETEIRKKLLNRMSKRQNSETDGDDDDVRFTIQPKEAQKAKEAAKLKEKEREWDRDRKRQIEKNDRRERHDKSTRPTTSRHDERHRKHEPSLSKDRRAGRDSEKYKRRDERHRRRGVSSSDEERHSKKPKVVEQPKDKLFDRILDPKPKRKVDEVIEVQDVEMSPIEILDEKDEKPITAFTLDSPARPKKYSKFESDPEDEPEIIEHHKNDNDKTPIGSSQNSPGPSEIYSDVDPENEEEESKIAKSIDDEDEEENSDQVVKDNIKWQDLTKEQIELLAPDVRKRLENAYQKELISRLPVFYPGIMGCRNIAEYECVNRVDEGTFGVVYRGKDKRTDEIVALKRLKMEKEKEGFPITALREINMLLKAGNHPNIVNVKEILIGTNMDKIYMAMEFVEHDLKSLIDTMVRKNKRFSTGEQKTLLKQLLSGIEHMHKLWILHRDLKTSNLLMSHRGVLKIADFGLAREYGDPLKKFTSIVVTLWYRSPELLLGTKFYSTPVDIWSVGCIMAEIILLKPLFPGRGELEQIKKIFTELGTPTEKIWPGVSELEGWKSLKFENYPFNQLRKRFLAGRLLNDTGFKLLIRLLTYDPSNRITATESLEHEWFEEEPLPVPPEDFPTFPAKSEQNKAPPAATKKANQQQRMEIVDPETAKLLKQFRVRPELMKPTGFSLKF